jgi:hypothetical protein
VERGEAIEGKLDDLISDFGDFRVDVERRFGRLEVSRETGELFRTNQISRRSFNWMRAGVLVSIAVGLSTPLIVKLVG